MAKRTSKIVRRQRPLVILSTREDRTPTYATFHAIAEQAKEYGWDLLDLRFTNGAIPDNRDIAGALVDCLPTDPLAERLLRMGCPAVRIGRLPHPKDDLLPAVLPDVAAGTRMAAEHFAERGFRNVGYVGRKPWSTGQSFYESFRKSAEALDCNFHLLQIETGSEIGIARYESRALQIGEWLSGIPKPIGLAAFADREAAMICTVCEAVGLSVPEDVAVLGSGNSSLDCEMAPVPLSSIDWAKDILGAQATRLLKTLIDGGPPSADPVLVAPSGVVTRRSTDIMAVDDPTVARAMRFIWDHLEQSLSVDDVVHEAGVGRRKLERAFSRHLGRGINEELRHKRLQRCCELLRSTDLRIADIATEIGFRSADHLHLSFRRKLGMTPRQYRLGQR